MVVSVAAKAQAAPPAPTDAEVKARVEALLKKMTLDEKIGQLNQPGALAMAPGSAKLEDVVRKGGAGSVLWLNDTKKFNALQKIAVEESPSKIPLLFGLDVIHGYRTIFPVPLAMAASWDPAVPERAQTVAARETRAAGLQWTFGPMVDIARDARWGRIVEGAGEDPYLGSAMAAAQVRGFQGPALTGAQDRVVASVKHFAGYGVADGGRDYDPVYLSEAQLRNVVLPALPGGREGRRRHGHERLHGPQRRARRPATVAAAPGAQERVGLQGLRGQRRVRRREPRRSRASPGTARTPPQRALHAGIDMDMASGTYTQNVAALVKDGSLKLAEVDEAVRRILTIKVRMGLFEQPYFDESLLAKIANSPEHRQESRWAAQRTMVLLRNEGKALPLSKDLKHVAVIGPLADSQEATDGPWLVVRPQVERGDGAPGHQGQAAEREDRVRPGPRDPARHPVVLRRPHPGRQEEGTRRRPVRRKPRSSWPSPPRAARTRS